MLYWNSFDMYWDSYIDKLYEEVVPEITQFLADKNYSVEIVELRNVIICQDIIQYGFKPRSKFSRKEKYIYFDVYISYTDYINKSLPERKKMIAQCFLNDMGILRKYKPKGFDIDQIKNDFLYFFQNEIKWL